MSPTSDETTKRLTPNQRFGLCAYIVCGYILKKQAVCKNDASIVFTV